jgi:hypothetical protein
MEIAGYAGALIIGITLGLIGGGGSILTVPVFAYLFKIDPVLATAYSLFVVGLTAGIGSIQYYRKGMVDLKMAMTFAIPSLFAVYLTRLFIIPAIPDPLFQTGSITLSKPVAIMLFFATVMFFSAFSMIRDRQGEDPNKRPDRINYFMVFIEGSVVGVLTGLVGAGGGFLIIPALVLLARIPMKMAVGTSLVIICLKSLIGFIGDIQAGQSIEWIFLGTFSIIAIFGILLGSWFSNYIDGKKIKKGFGWFVLVMSIVILIKEI